MNSVPIKQSNGIFHSKISKELIELQSKILIRTKYGAYKILGLAFQSLHFGFIENTCKIVKIQIRNHNSDKSTDTIIGGYQVKSNLDLQQLYPFPLLIQ